MSDLNNLRPSSFLYSHGPGSILESRSGPTVVMDMRRLFEGIEGRPVVIGGQRRNLSITDFEIREPRLSGSLGGARLVALPSNSELGEPDDEPIYPTHGAFPRWSLCTNPDHQHLYLGWVRSNEYRRCWMCEKDARDTGVQALNSMRMAGAHALRFVSACPRGHLQDVDWVKLVHNGQDCPVGNTNSFKWYGGGGRISDIWIHCKKKCGARANLGRLYNDEHDCGGSHIHLGYNEDCPARARMQQRGSAGLYLSQIESSLDISALPETAMRALDHPLIRDRIIILQEDGDWPDRDRLRRRVDNADAPQRLKNSLIDRIDDPTRWPKLREQIETRVLGIRPPGQDDIKEEEFNALLESSINGSPPPPIHEEDGPESSLRIRLEDCYDVGFGNGTIRVVPIERLRVVSALRGFSREVASDGEPSALVESRFEFGEGREWHPAIENFSEGVFLHFVESKEAIHLDRPRAATWSVRHKKSNEVQDNPVYVWWHTLSHMLIKHLGLDSGFSSASIRERVYCHENSDDGAFTGGILLYPAQQGGDGTLGGLVNVVKNRDAFTRILEKCQFEAHTCSTDPLCEEEVQFRDGAACFACCLTSETSCENRNHGLDRLMVKESYP
jgi:hypothetical protein